MYDLYTGKYKILPKTKRERLRGNVSETRDYNFIHARSVFYSHKQRSKGERKIKIIEIAEILRQADKGNICKKKINGHRENYRPYNTSYF